MVDAGSEPTYAEKIRVPPSPLGHRAPVQTPSAGCSSVDIFFHILVLHEYWVMEESRLLLKRVLGGVRIVAFFISSLEQTQ